MVKTAESIFKAKFQRRHISKSAISIKIAFEFFIFPPTKKHTENSILTEHRLIPSGNIKCIFEQQREEFFSLLYYYYSIECMQQAPHADIRAKINFYSILMCISIYTTTHTATTQPTNQADPNRPSPVNIWLWFES